MLSSRGQSDRKAEVEQTRATPEMKQEKKCEMKQKCRVSTATKSNQQNLNALRWVSGQSLELQRRRAFRFFTLNRVCVLVACPGCFPDRGVARWPWQSDRGWWMDGWMENWNFYITSGLLCESAGTLLLIPPPQQTILQHGSYFLFSVRLNQCRSSRQGGSPCFLPEVSRGLAPRTQMRSQI